MDKRPEFHGSDLEKIEEYYHIPKEEIVCFSANVNPLGLSEAVRQKLCDHLDVICRYPDRAYTSLRQTIGTYCGANPAHIVVGNGSTELISLLISQRGPKKALVLGPTYSEYARELSLVGGSMEYYHLREADDFVLDIDDFLSHVTGEVDMVILCNPNNPTSSAIPREDMKRIIAQCKKQGVFVMIDETYVEFAPDVQAVSAISLVPAYDNFMVIRGVSKFFAAPGLRFGYGITSNQTFLSALLTHQNPWSLNSIGAFAGEEMLKIVESKEFSRLPGNMPGVAQEAFETLLHTRDGQLCDILVDHDALAALQKAAEATKDPTLIKYAGLTAASADIKIAVRAASTGKDETFLDRALAECSELDIDSLKKAAISGTEAVYAYLANTDFADAVPKLRESSAAFECWCDDLIIRSIKPQLWNSFGLGPLAAYILAKETELRSVRILLTARQNGFSADRVRERVRETYV